MDSGPFVLNITAVLDAEIDCTDGFDDDADRDTDCEDTECDPVCFEDCVNGIDDDGDGDTDCFDRTCTPDPTCLAACPNDVIVDTLVASTAGMPNSKDPSCGFSGGPDRTVAFTAPDDGSYHFSLSRTGTAFDTVLGLLDTCGGSELACNDVWSPDQPNGGEEVLTEMLLGETVIVVVDGFSELEFGDFELAVRAITPTELECTDALDDDLDGALDCADAERAADPACQGTVTVAWSNEVVSPLGCFTFSTPTALGATANYVDDAGSITLDFAAPPPGRRCSPARTWART